MNNIDIGHFCLVAGWFCALYGFFVGFCGVRLNKPVCTQSAAHSVYLCTFFTLASLVALAVAFVSHDYRYLYVWQHSNNDMPAVYCVSAIWGGMDGSMLLWAAIMTCFSSLVLIRSKNVQRVLLAWVIPVLSAATGFFLSVITWLTNPFRFVPDGSPIADGNGLNPLLQNPSMIVHPPMLYTGFTGFVVPFAFCFAALLSGKLDTEWIRVTRRWTLFAWAFLTVGIVLGGHWAYVELGWGGFWAWDPVENASFLPWLTGTAFLHSVMVQEQRGMLKVWNSSLSVLTYSLTIFGTFLTRSGVVQSVHAFADTDVGWVFLAYLAVIGSIALGLICFRWKDLKPENKLESYFSRESAFLFNNLALLGICFATFWGVMFPIISEAVAGEKSVVGPPFFNRVNVPLFLALIFLMGVGPLVSWRRSSFRVLLRTFAKPLIAGSLLTILFLFLDSTRVYAAMAFGLCLFVVVTIEAEFRRAVKVRRQQVSGESLPASIAKVIQRKPRRYGGLLVHVGISVIAVAITASMAYKIEKDLSLKIGERVQVGRYTLELADVKEEQLPNYTALVTRVNVYDTASNTIIATMNPERRGYKGSGESTTEVDIRNTLREDLYIALAGLDVKQTGGKPAAKIDIKNAPALLKVFVNPLQVWLWFGAMIVVMGAIVVIWQGFVFESVPFEVSARERIKV